VFKLGCVYHQPWNKILCAGGYIFRGDGAGSYTTTMWTFDLNARQYRKEIVSNLRPHCQCIQRMLQQVLPHIVSRPKLVSYNGRLFAFSYIDNAYDQPFSLEWVGNTTTTWLELNWINDGRRVVSVSLSFPILT